MARKNRRSIGWKDPDISGGGNRRNRERQYRGKKGERHYIRIVTECEEYQVHSVDDVLDPRDDGEPRIFNMNCSKHWDDEADDYVGECLACERDYDINTRYICGILLLAVKKGTKGKAQTLDPENAPHYWDFGADKYRKISNHAIELADADPPKPIQKVEFVVTCEDEGFQKLDINVSQSKQLTTRDHMEEWAEQGPSLVDGASGALSLKEQKRSLTKRKKKKDRSDSDSSGRVSKVSKKTKRRPVEEDENLDVEATGDDELDDLLAGL
jgi:hypothetical protein